MNFKRVQETFMIAIIINIILNCFCIGTDTYCLIHKLDNSDAETMVRINLLVCNTSLTVAFICAWFKFNKLIKIHQKPVEQILSSNDKIKVITIKPKNRNRPPPRTPQNPDVPQPMPVHQPTEFVHLSCIQPHSQK